MTTPLPAEASNSDPAILPVEIWLYIFRLATGSLTENSHPDFPHVNKDLYKFYSEQEDHECKKRVICYLSRLRLVQGVSH